MRNTSLLLGFGILDVVCGMLPPHDLLSLGCMFLSGLFFGQVFERVIPGANS